MPDGYHPPLEEYLEAIQIMAEEGTTTIQARIAERLGRSVPSVKEMLERLIGEGYVERQGRAFVLTGQGRLLAESVIRKHRLAERLLVDVIGLPWHKAHLEAGRWEHVMSDEVERRLVVLLGDPATCPHGNPIPGAASPAGQEGQVSLDGVEPGNKVRLERVTEEVELDMGALELLDSHGFVPGCIAVVRGRDSRGGTTVEVGAETLEVDAALARHLFVVPL